MKIQKPLQPRNGSYCPSESPNEDLLDERSGLNGLHSVNKLAVQRNIPVDRDVLEKQDTYIRAGDELCAKGQRMGEVIAIDLAARTIDISLISLRLDWGTAWWQF